jgi:hypothetical protein
MAKRTSKAEATVFLWMAAIALPIMFFIWLWEDHRWVIWTSVGGLVFFWFVGFFNEEQTAMPSKTTADGDNKLREAERQVQVRQQAFETEAKAQKIIRISASVQVVPTVVVQSAQWEYVDEKPKRVFGERPHAWPDVIEHGIAGLEDCIAHGEWDLARATLQQMGYTMMGADDASHKKFTAYIRSFYSRDPLHQGIMKIAIPLIKSNLGILQTELYKHFIGLDAETIRSQFYIAEQMGEIRRVSKGRSYQVFANDGVELTPS